MDEDIEVGDYDEEASLSSANTEKRRRRHRCKNCMYSFRQGIRRRRKLIFLFLYLAYFCYAVLRCLWVDCYDDSERWTLILVTCFWTIIGVFYLLFVKLCWPFLKAFLFERLPCCLPLSATAKDNIRWVLYGILLICYIGFILLDTLLFRFEPNALIPLAGVFIILIICGLSSAKFRKIAPIRLQPVVIGFFMQFVVGVIVLRWSLGERFCSWLAYLATQFFGFANEGAKYVWTTAFNSRDLAFSVLPIIPFFAAFTGALAFTGWLDLIIKLIANLMEKLLGTTAAESTTCCANVFVGMAESPFIVRRFLPYMTRSELHAMMTGSFATLAVYMFKGLVMEEGVEAKHLLAASLMAGPGALALSKLVHPEIEQSSMKAKNIDLYASPRNHSSPKSVVESLYDGASQSISVVAHIAVNLIAIISMKAFVNGVLTWFGEKIGFGNYASEDSASLEHIAMYIFWPLAYMIGIPWHDCQAVAHLLGSRLFANDPFTPYTALSSMAANQREFNRYYCHYVHNVTFPSNPVLFRNGTHFLPATNTTLGMKIDARSAAIATYALCGYANITAIGIQIGAIGALAPSTKSTLASLAFRALLTATAVNLINAATAGMLLETRQPNWNTICSTIA